MALTWRLGGIRNKKCVWDPFVIHQKYGWDPLTCGAHINHILPSLFLSASVGRWPAAAETWEWHWSGDGGVRARAGAAAAEIETAVEGWPSEGRKRATRMAASSPPSAP